MKTSNKFLNLLILIIIVFSVFIIALPFIKLKMNHRLDVSYSESKNVPTEKYVYALSNFDTLRVTGISKVTVEQSDKSEIIINASKGFKDCVTYREFDGELRIDVDPSKRFLYDGEVNVVIKAKNLNYVRLQDLCNLKIIGLKELREIRTDGISYINLVDVSGLSDFDNGGLCYFSAEKLNTSDLNIRTRGTTYIKLEGHANSVSISGEGLGRICGKKFIVDSVNADIKGFIYVDMGVRNLLNIDSMIGLTKFIYYGDPKVKKGDVKGFSRIEQKNGNQ